MRRIVLLGLLLATEVPSGDAFRPCGNAPRPTTPCRDSKVNEISHELVALDEKDVSPHVTTSERPSSSLPPPRGFEPRESVVARLRRELRAKDRLHHELLDEMDRMERRQVDLADLKNVLKRTSSEIQQQNAMLRRNKEGDTKRQEETLLDLLGTLQRLEDNLVQANAFALAWETAEVELWRERRHLDDDARGVRSLLWRAIRLSGRKMRNVVRRLFHRN